MRLIVGLGNPGPKYESTRHNCGFMVVDELARRAGKLIRTPECQALTARAVISGHDLLLVKPQTYMNLSGVSVIALIQKYEIADPSEIIVITDDLAIPFGRIRIRPGGSSGGHNGLKSLIAKLQTQNFPRIRLGIAPEHPISDTAEFVLMEFPKKDRQALNEMVLTAAEAAEAILTTDIATAMSRFN